MRPDELPASGNLSVSAGAGAPIPLRDTLAALPAGQWTTLGVPLKCFAASGADVSKLDLLLKLQSDAKASVSVSRVAIGAISEAAKVMDCPTSK